MDIQIKVPNELIKLLSKELPNAGKYLKDDVNYLTNKYTNAPIVKVKNGYKRPPGIKGFGRRTGKLANSVLKNFSNRGVSIRHGINYGNIWETRALTQNRYKYYSLFRPMYEELKQITRIKNYIVKIVRELING